MSSSYGYKPYGVKPGFSNEPKFCRNGICKEIGFRSADSSTKDDVQTPNTNTLNTLSPEQNNIVSSSSLTTPIAITLLVYPFPEQGQNHLDEQGSAKIPQMQVGTGYLGNLEEDDDLDPSILDYLLPEDSYYGLGVDSEWTILDEAMINEFFLLTGLEEFNDDENSILVSRTDPYRADSIHLLEQCSNIHASNYPQILATIRVMKESVAKND